MSNKITNSKGINTNIKTNTNAIVLDNSSNPPTKLDRVLGRLYNKATVLNRMILDNTLRINQKPFKTDTQYKKNTIVKDIDGTIYISRNDISLTQIHMKKDTTNWVPLSRTRESICIMKSTYTNGTHVYERGEYYTPSEISEMLNNDDYYGYIQNGDWIELETRDYKFTLIANIDTYNTSIDNITHNIDFICIKADAKNDKNTKYTTPWNGDVFFDTDVSTNDKILEGDMPISLSTYASDAWHNYIPTFLENHTIGFGEEFSSHIYPKIKSVPIKIISKKSAKDEINSRGETAIHENFNMGKVWFVTEAEMFGTNILSTDLDGMCSTQYPMFEKVHYRKFKLNNKYVKSILSSVENNAYLNPLYVDTHNRVSTNADYTDFHPIFGMRFY